METPRKSDPEILSVVNRVSWLLLAALTVATALLASVDFGIGVAAGGLIALGNSFWLRSILERILIQQRADARSYALIRYLLRLTVSGIIIVALLRAGINIAGLLVGLSVLVISITTVSVFLSFSDKGENP